MGVGRSRGALSASVTAGGLGAGDSVGKVRNAIVAKPGRSLLGSWADMVVVDLEGASLPARDAGSCACHIGWARRHGWRAWRHELSHRGAERGGEGCCHESASTMRPPQQGQM